MISPEPSELQELVRDLHQQASPWCPAGLGSRLHWGPQAQAGAYISAAKLDRIVEHSAGDFTVTVEAGMPLAALQAELGATNQWLAVDAPWGSGHAGSVGGLVARGLAGGLRQRYLGIRDQLIGIEVLRSDGTTAQAGGSVVKNVAGYDLMRLFCGSWGSLGLITKLTLRTFPKQAHRAGLLWTGELTALERLRKECLAAALMPQRLDWLSSALTGQGQPGLMLSLVSISQTAIAEQLQELEAQASQIGLATRSLDRDALEALEDSARGSGQLNEDLWLLHLGVPPAAARSLLQEGLLQELPCAIAAGVGQGWAWGQAPSYAIAALRQRCEQLGGMLSVLQQPNQIATRLPVWGDHAARAVIEAIKRDFDPLQQLNRGRLPGIQA
ncbi:MAG: FAD-binding oxidoreductase [Vulcanococcus sp.]